MNDQQQKVFNSIAIEILDIDLPDPIIVGIDGKDASGKTTFADNLSKTLWRQTDRKIIRVSIDNFFQPRKIRYQQKNQAIGCYEDTFDIQGIIKYLLNPIKSRDAYATKIFDYGSDSPVYIMSEPSPPDAIFIIDGVFLHRPEFQDYWGFAVLLEVSDEIAIERGASRDTNRIGNYESARQKYIDRYIASQRIYYDLCSPTSRADIIVDNTDYQNPKIVV